MRRRLLGNHRGAARSETAITLPLVLLVTVAIFEFGRAYQTWQVLTNAAREGARVAVLTGTTDAQVKKAVKDYADIGGVVVTDDKISIDRTIALAVGTGSKITVAFPFDFMVLNPVAKMVVSDSKLGETLTISAVALMRNEGS